MENLYPHQTGTKIIPFATPPTLTPEYLRQSSGMLHLTDEQANEMIDSLNALARILLTIPLPEKNILIDNQQVVNSYIDISEEKTLIPLQSTTKRKNKAA